MKNLAGKTQLVTNALIDAYEVRKNAGTTPALDAEGNDITMHSKGDVDENEFLKIWLEPLHKEGIHDDEALDILRALGKACGFQPDSDEIHGIVYKEKYQFIDVYKHEQEESWTAIISKLRTHEPQFETDYSQRSDGPATPQSTPKTSLQIPSGTRWESLIFQFTDDENLVVHFGQKQEVASFRKMGLVDKRTNKPDIQWALLKILAQHDGELKLSDSESDPKFKKAKQKLEARMQIYFGIDFPLFDRYQTNHSYKIKLKLIPAPDSPVSEKDKLDDEGFNDDTKIILQRKTPSDV